MIINEARFIVLLFVVGHQDPTEDSFYFSSRSFTLGRGSVQVKGRYIGKVTSSLIQLIHDN